MQRPQVSALTAGSESMTRTELTQPMIFVLPVSVMLSVCLCSSDHAPRDSYSGTFRAAPSTTVGKYRDSLVLILILKDGKYAPKEVSDLGS